MQNEVKAREEKPLQKIRPATDILEREDGYHVFMDIPGVRREDLVLDLQDNELAVSAKTAEIGSQEERYADVEFGPVEYSRVISVSDLVDKEGIKANLTNGVLSLHLPKAEKALPKKIEIQAG
ncbi:Molecular chaperone IbpA, HSP20 family [Paucidesulfovibrio gracilis DSM 16080]|uniref:Molecular chaperone IbpA, HSP20 family n=1 Tax=Paucidesulfovibrio gracilis DSM 16080 TaxID=1121449 RepID=A0A1T4Y525_9BACT|nr:Hsp20/alpha crystallin family protein [Paucidesulfovibrio gracilis]SKA96836.1 Molecular chaperone IbpA, HSP20 family [Paucidesulfovibrio gracilis DSM 16080]